MISVIMAIIWSRLTGTLKAKQESERKKRKKLKILLTDCKSLN